MIARTAHTPGEVCALLQLLAITCWEPLLEEARWERVEGEARVLALRSAPELGHRAGLEERGVNIKALQDAGGWSNLVTPLGYIISNEIANDELIDLPPAQPRSRKNL